MSVLWNASEDEMYMVPQALKDAISQSRLVIFVGAGCSQSLGLPNWKNLVISFLKENSSYVDGAEPLIGVIENGYLTPLEVLDKIEEKKKYVYAYLLKEFSKYKSGSDVHSAIWRLSRKVATTNFDKALESSKPSEIQVILPTSEYSMSLLGELDGYLFKMHGDIEQPDKCALFSSDYKKLYSSESIFTEEIRSLIKGNSILFLGFSFSDPYFEKLFGALRDIYREYSREHFIACVDDINVPGVSRIALSTYEELAQFLNSLDYDSEKSGLAADGQGGASAENTESMDGRSEVRISGAGVDTPPDIPIFVGREHELRLLRDGLFKSICITGIGGQGKSALAARHMECAGDSYEACFWRDFKEEGHNYVTKLSSIITSISSAHSETDIVGLNEDEITTLLFDSLWDKKLLVVLDNVDSYVDPANLVFVGPISKLQKSSESRRHSSTFIFTCRPLIQHASSNFFQMGLDGFTEEDIASLVQKHHVNLSLLDKVGLESKIYRITNGHPLWTLLIIAQAKRGKAEVNKFISEIELRQLSSDSENAILAQEVLNSVWETLNKHQKTMLRFLSESPGSESIGELEQIVSRALNHNQFAKSLRTLRSLGLIIDKKSGQFIELHPLVKQFVFGKYPGNERSKYIALFVDYFGQILLVLRPKISTGLAYKEFSKWIDSISLNITAGKNKEAYNLLAEVFGPMKSAGHSEQLAKIVIQFLDSIPWTVKFDSGLRNFDGKFSEMVKLLAEYGEPTKAREYISSFIEVVGQSNERYIRAVSTQCYVDWVSGDLAAAVKAGELGEHLLARGSIGDKFDVGHTLALARRDSGDHDGVQKALRHFLRGEDIARVCDSAHLDEQLGAPYYGNIGRSLCLLGRAEEAVLCYAKAYRLLSRTDSGDKILNLGYALKWIFEVLPETDSLRSVFLASGYRKWRKVAPPLANRLKRDNLPSFSSVAFHNIDVMEEWQLDKACDDWVKSVLG